MRDSGIVVVDRRFGAAVAAFVLLTVALNTPAVAQEPVKWADPKLKAAVKTALDHDGPQGLSLARGFRLCCLGTPLSLANRHILAVGVGAL